MPKKETKKQSGKKKGVNKAPKKKEVAKKAKKATKEVAKKKARKKSPSTKTSEIRYWEGVGRRKTAVARVRIFKGKEKKILVNDRDYKDYFQISDVSQIAVLPLKKLDLLGKMGVTVKVRGGGLTSQAEAVRHGLARALVKYNEKYRPELRRLGYLTRDPRMKERKKFGLKRARRAPQWSKR